jgi:hypothetical protein
LVFVGDTVARIVSSTSASELASDWMELFEPALTIGVDWAIGTPGEPKELGFVENKFPVVWAELLCPSWSNRF